MKHSAWECGEARGRLVLNPGLDLRSKTKGRGWSTVPALQARAELRNFAQLPPSGPDLPCQGRSISFVRLASY
jgi:hypothetical protein